jgi:hypothetical protein
MIDTAVSRCPGNGSERRTRLATTKILTNWRAAAMVQKISRERISAVIERKLREIDDPQMTVNKAADVPSH